MFTTSIYRVPNSHGYPQINRFTILPIHSSLGQCIFSPHGNVPYSVCAVRQYLDRWDLIRNHTIVNLAYMHMYIPLIGQLFD